jgi:hypothetical protein
MLLSFIVLVILIIWLAISWDEFTNRELIVSAAIGYFSVVLGVFAFFWKKDRDKFQFGNEKREEFILNETFMDIRSRIEHNDVVLQTVIAILNLPHPEMYKPSLLPPNIGRGMDDTKKLHECFDNYLNWIEGFAILWKGGLIGEEELEGLWSYCSHRLREVKVEQEEVEKCLKELNKDIIINDFISKLKAQEKRYDPIDGSEIDPITKPIWFYINEPEYDFPLLIDLIKKAHSRLSQKRKLSKTG